MIADEVLMPIHAVAERLGVSRTMVYSLMNAGELAYVKLGRSRRIPNSAVRDLIAKNLRGPNAR